MPDIDMDFETRYRDEMIRYAAERYGRDHVAQIITFGSIKARNAVRDAARQSGKQAVFETSGGDVQLDRTLVESLYGPLLHLVRNAVAVAGKHGVADVMLA